MGIFTRWRCPMCGGKVKDRTQPCPHCGYDASEPFAVYLWEKRQLGQCEWGVGFHRGVCEFPAVRTASVTIAGRKFERRYCDEHAEISEEADQ